MEFSVAGQENCSLLNRPQWHMTVLLILVTKKLLIRKTQKPLQCHLCLHHWWLWRMCRMKARGHCRETAFAKPMGKEKPHSSYWHWPWARLACSSHFKAYPILGKSVIGQACSALLFVTNVKQWDLVLFWFFAWVSHWHLYWRWHSW